MDALVAWAGGDPAAGDAVRDCEHRGRRPEARAVARAARRVLAAARRRGSLHAVGRPRRGAQQREGPRPRDGGDEPRAERPDARDGRACSPRRSATSSTRSRTSARTTATPPKRPTPRSRASGDVEHAYRAAMSALLSEADVATMFALARDLPAAVAHGRPRAHRRRTGLVRGREGGVSRKARRRTAAGQWCEPQRWGRMGP